MLEVRGWDKIVRDARRTQDLEYLCLSLRGEGTEQGLGRIDPWTPAGRALLVDYLGPDAEGGEDDGWQDGASWAADYHEDPPEEDEWQEGGDDGEEDEDEDAPTPREPTRREVIDAALQYLLDMARDSALPGGPTTFRIIAYAPKGLRRWSRTFHLRTARITPLASSTAPGDDDAPEPPPTHLDPPELVGGDGRAWRPTGSSSPDAIAGHYERLLGVQHDAYLRIVQLSFAVAREAGSMHRHHAGISRREVARLGDRLDRTQGRYLDLVDTVLTFNTKRAELEGAQQQEAADNRTKAILLEQGLDQLSTIGRLLVVKTAAEKGLPPAAIAAMLGGSVAPELAALAGMDEEEQQALSKLLQQVNETPELKAALMNPKLLKQMEDPRVRALLAEGVLEMANHLEQAQQAAAAAEAEAAAAQSTPPQETAHGHQAQSPQ